MRPSTLLAMQLPKLPLFLFPSNLSAPIPRTRRIKRCTKQGAGLDDGSDADNNSDSISSTGDDGLGDDDDDEGTEVCPPGCDTGLYDSVVELRERRLDEDDAAAEVAKESEALRKEIELLAKKARFMEQSLLAINQVGWVAGQDCMAWGWGQGGDGGRAG